MSKNKKKDISQASDSALIAAASSGYICGSEKTVDAATKELIRRTTF
ncbi:MAG: hypothetical protein AAFO04_29885 [Cyanobacteria bacterium J06592_8]